MKTKDREKKPTCHAKSLSEAIAEAGRVGFSALPDNAPERQTAWRDMETAFHKAGVYREALRGINTLRTEPPPDGDEARAVHTWALSLSLQYDAPTLKALDAAPTFEERERIRADLQRAAEERERQRLADARAAAERELAARRAEEQRRKTEARERTARERQAQDDLHTLAEASRAKAGAVTAEPEAKKRAYKPFTDHEQRRFAELWKAARTGQGRPPYARDFLAEYAEELKKIRVVSKADVERIRDAVSKRGLLPRWNKPRKQPKSGGKRCQ